MSALESIITWSMTLPAWEADAIRRILTQTEFNDKDKEEITNFIKKEYGLIKEQSNDVLPKKLQKGDISGVPEQGISIKLKSVKCISGINAIPPESTLTFLADGLNVVYGDNGSGKSGYARVLKKACRARDMEEDILCDIYCTSAENAQADIEIDYDGINKTINWENGNDARDELSNICVFDSKCARIIIDSKNNAQYLPYGTHVFEKLVSILQDIKGKLELEKPIPQIPKIEGIDLSTEAGKFFSSISIKTKKNELEKITKWDKNDEEKFKELNKKIINIENNDPLKQAEKIKKSQDRIKNFALYLLSIRNKLFLKKETEIKNQLESLLIAEKALEEASKLSLSNEPLKGAGSNVWQKLYIAAKQYSMEQAYPNKDFPMIEENSLCVLCMQPIENVDVKDRFKRFKNFMEDTTKQDTEREKKKLKDIRQTINDIIFYDDDAYSAVFEEIYERDKELPDILKAYITFLKKRKEDLLQLIDEKKYKTLPSVISCPKRRLKDVYNRLENKVKKLEKDADPKKLAELKGKLKEQEAKRLLSHNKASIIKYFDELVKAAQYEKCIRAIKTRGITVKGKEIISETLSPQLESALESELRQLGGSRFPVFFKVTGDKGITEHKLHLKGTTSGKKVSLSDVLSEGEQRVIAIAGFLAELETSGQKSPIVFDDPVCSLDHKFKRNIAKRLVSVSKERQVIVYTHDLPFLMMLQENTEKEDLDINIKSIQRTYSTPGICTDHVPWDAMNVKERVTSLKDKCNKLKAKHSSILENDYNSEAGLLYGGIRETWERLVEELLLNGVVYRFGRDIQTQRLRIVAGDITEDDYKKIDEAMTKASKYLIGHDSSSGLNEPPPHPEEIMEDINNLEDYRKELSRRKRQARR